MTTWHELPKLKDGHPSEDVIYRPHGIGPDGELEYLTDTTPCGEVRPGAGVMFCAAHLKLIEEEYPQGWDYYPGDICKHGKYVGGMGVDHMCQLCELGIDYDDA